MKNETYLLLSRSDARQLWTWLYNLQDSGTEEQNRLIKRLRDDTGGDFEDIRKTLRLETCAACAIEGQERWCVAHAAQKVGRRIARLIARADYENPPATPEPVTIEESRQ